MKAIPNRPGLIGRQWRVLQIGKYYPPFFGGMESHLQNLCRNLQGLMDLEVVVANHGKQKSETVVDWMDEVKVTRVGTISNVAATPICPQMVKAIRSSSADIVHLHHPNPMATLAYLASGHKGPLIVTYHSDVIRQKILAKVFEPLLHQLLARASVIIATSPNYIESSPVLSRYRGKCQVIPFGIPVEQFQQPNRNMVEALRQKYGSKIVLTVGRLVYYKGIEYLIRAMENTKGHLLIVGEGPLREDLEREVGMINVGKQVTFLGNVSNEDLVNYYHAMEVFALPSILRSEAFGIVQLEAMACGKPVVNTQLASGVPFVSRHGETGLTVAPRDPIALADAINRLLTNRALKAAYGKAAQSRVEREFSEEIMSRRIFQLYAQVVSQSHLHDLAVAIETVNS